MKQFIFILMSAALVLAPGGCKFIMGPDSPAGGEGTLSISFGKAGSGNTRGATTGEELLKEYPEVLASLEYKLILTDPSGKDFTYSVSGKENFKKTAVLGEWRIEAKAYQNDGLAGICEPFSFTVMPGINSIRVPMALNEGYFDIDISVLDSLEHGTIRPYPAAAFPGTTITLRVKPEAGYVLNPGSLLVLTAAEELIEPIPSDTAGTYTFTMPAEEVTVFAAVFTEPIRYVKSDANIYGDGFSWSTASNDIQKMIDELAVLAAANPDCNKPFVVKVGMGAYTPKYAPGPDGRSIPEEQLEENGLTIRDKTFILRQGVQVWGGYPSSGNSDGDDVRDVMDYPTILSGDLNEDGTGSKTDNAYHVVLGLGIPNDGKTVLDGFTITGGNADGNESIRVKDYPVNRNSGGGIYLNSSSPKLKNVIIFSNEAGNRSGGMYNYASSPELSDVTISNNKAVSGSGGGMYNEAGSCPVLIAGTISDNEAASNGGGIYNTGKSSPVLAGVTISGNTTTSRGGGMYNNMSSPVLVNVTISGNSKHGMYNYGSSPVLVNVGIFGHTAANGGGMYNDTNSRPVLTNVTISGNSATVDPGSSIGGGGMYNDNNSSPKIWNSIIWGNKAAAGNANIGNTDTNSKPVISYSIVEDLTDTDDTDNGNILLESGAGNSPFVDWKDPNDVIMPNSNGTYILRTDSPAVDAGDDGVYPESSANSIFLTNPDQVRLSAAASAAIDAALSKDLDGKPRKVKAGVESTIGIDMGAYEAQHLPQ
jgi:hypothetical protein